MYNFYVMDGKKLIDYKPNKKHYASAIIRFSEKMGCLNEMSNEKFLSAYPDQFKQYLYLLIKFISNAFDVFGELIEEGKIHREPTQLLTYLIDGKALDMPLVKRFWQYKTDHWLPTVFCIGPEED